MIILRLKLCKLGSQLIRSLIKVKSNFVSKIKDCFFFLLDKKLKIEIKVSFQKSLYIIVQQIFFAKIKNYLS